MRRLVAAVATLVVAATAAVVTPAAEAAPLGNVIIPAPCLTSKPYNPNASMTALRDGITANWGFPTTGSYWTDPRYRPLVKVIWEDLDAISCTPYLAALKNNVGGPLTLNATSIGGWVAGDYGLTKGGAVSLDFPQLLTSYQEDPGHVGRLFIHEITHAYSANRDSNPAYWTEFGRLYAKNGKFGTYGDNQSEVMSEVIGFYVARCAVGNPYTTSAQRDYYEFAKKIFGGKEFGPALGQPLVCDAKELAAQAQRAEAAKYADARSLAEAVAAQRQQARAEIEAAGTAQAD